MAEGPSGRGGYVPRARGPRRGNTPRGGGGRGGGGGPVFPQKRPMENYGEFEGDQYGFSKKRKISEDVYRFLVPEQLVRVIIGKGGEHIKSIKEDAQGAGIDTKVSIYAQGTNNVPLEEGSVDRVMSIQSTMEGLEKALEQLLPNLQRNTNRVAPGKSSGTKLEIRLIVPAHSCSAIIGKGGTVIKEIKEKTKSYIQVYTNPLPNSEEHVVRIQNFEAPDLVMTAVRVFESIAETKGKAPITMYDPQYWAPGDYGDTGSYIDSDMYQAQLRAAGGVYTKTSGGYGGGMYTKGSGGGGQQSYGGGQQGYGGQGGYYEQQPYDEYSGYDQSQNYGYEYHGGYEEPAPAPPMRARGRGGPPRGRGGPRGGPPRGRGGPPRGASRGRGGGPPPAEEYNAYPY